MGSLFCDFGKDLVDAKGLSTFLEREPAFLSHKISSPSRQRRTNRALGLCERRNLPLLAKVQDKFSCEFIGVSCLQKLFLKECVLVFKTGSLVSSELAVGIKSLFAYQFASLVDDCLECFI